MARQSLAVTDPAVKVRAVGRVSLALAEVKALDLRQLQGDDRLAVRTARESLEHAARVLR